MGRKLNNYKDMKVSAFDKPDLSIKTVILYHGGRYPKNTKPARDIALPARLWPNAKFIIRCDIKGNTGKNNLEYFRKLFTKNEIELISQDISNEDICKIPADLLYIHHENFNAFGGVVRKCTIDAASITRLWEGKIYVVYNDESFCGYYDLIDYINKRAKNANFLVKNPTIFEEVKRKETSWNNVTVLMNENNICNWHEWHFPIDYVAKDINVAYMSNVLLYELNVETIKAKESYNKKGIYAPLWMQDRTTLCNKMFSGDGTLDLTFKGPGSDKLNDSIKGDGKYVDNLLLRQLFREYDWALYIGRGHTEHITGATFYEPILNGLPVFMWIGIDPNKNTFKDIDCYFSSETELKSLVEKWDMKDLYSKQVKTLFNKDI